LLTYLLRGVVALLFTYLLMVLILPQCAVDGIPHAIRQPHMSTSSMNFLHGGVQQDETATYHSIDLC